MLVSEIFFSIQGESSYSGLACVFVRLAGCNLACTWCDTPYARDDLGASEMSPDGVVDEVERYGCGLVEITGGEPLVQEETPGLAAALADRGLEVLVESNGSVPIGGLDERVVRILDIKCPSSGHAGSFLIENLDSVRPVDEVKFVMAGREDYDFAVRFMEEYLCGRTGNVLFAPVTPELDPALLASWILRDSLTVRLQLQMHKYIWPERGGDGL